MNIYSALTSWVVAQSTIRVKNMITFKKFQRNSEKRTKSKVETLIKTVFYLLTISVVKARISSTSTISKHIFGEDTSSFCVNGKCAVVFPNGTSVSLPLAKFYTYMTEYIGHKNIINDDSNPNNFHLNEQNNLEKWPEKDERTEKLEGSKINFTAATTEISATMQSTFDETAENSDLKNSTVAPANESNATELSSTICKICNELSALDSNDTEQNLTSLNFQNRHKIHSRSISDVYPANNHTSADCSELTWIDDSNKTINSETTKSKCKVEDPKSISVDDSNDPNHGSSKSNSSNYETIKPPITNLNPIPETDHDPDCDDRESENHGPIIQATPEEIEKAKKMTECARLNTKHGMVCVCNTTYCDKFIPPDQTPPWIYTWYTTSPKGHRFRKRRNDLTPYKGDEDGAFYVNTSHKYQKIIGFGGAFTDSSCKLMQDLSKETKKNLLESYFGLFGINYKLGRVPIGGTDFSPRFYTYLDTRDEFMSTFMLTEQDFKYKIPIILEVIELTHNQLKLIGCAWSAPMWMKTSPQKFHGFLQRKYFEAWAFYHLKFLDQYLNNGVKFWAISTGNEPMNHYHSILTPQINSLEWTPYEQSEWVYHLYQMLGESAHNDVLLLAFDENREFIEVFMKYFFENYHLSYFDDEYRPLAGGCMPDFIPNPIMEAIAGIQIHAYMDSKSNLPYLQRTKDLFPDKFFLYSEFSCAGAPESGSWTCGEKYATGIITALNHWAAGWLDWNIALNTTGGPTYVNNVLHSPILVDVKKDEFYKESMFYIMGHVSLFVLPDSYRVETKTSEGLEEIYAVSAVRPDGGKVIVFYNKYEKDKQVTFIIDKKYKLSIKAPKKSMNSVLFW